MPVRLVTDSTAMLEPALVAALGIAVVPLQVVIGPKVFDEGTDEARPEVVAQALRDFTPVSTSRPAPVVFAETYRRLAEEGATEIVSVHLSAEMSGTFESAQLAARDAGIRVVCVDTRQVGLAVGYAVRAAAAALEAGGSADEAADAARAVAGRRQLAVLRRHPGVPAPRRAHRRGRRAAGQRAGGEAAAGLRGRPGRPAGAGAHLDPGAEPARGARGRGRGGAAGRRQRRPPRQPRAGRARSPNASRTRLADGLAGRSVDCGELGAVLGAHVGPGMIAVCVAPRP